MSKQLLIASWQGKLEAWNCKIENKVGEPDFEAWKKFCLRAIENIEGSGVYQLAQQGYDVSGFTVEEIKFDNISDDDDLADRKYDWE